MERVMSDLKKYENLSQLMKEGDQTAPQLMRQLMINTKNKSVRDLAQTALGEKK